MCGANGTDSSTEEGMKEHTTITSTTANVHRLDVCVGLQLLRQTQTQDNIAEKQAKSISTAVHIRKRKKKPMLLPWEVVLAPAKSRNRPIMASIGH